MAIPNELKKRGRKKIDPELLKQHKKEYNAEYYQRRREQQQLKNQPLPKLDQPLSDSKD
jgi:hypothetical protein